MKLEIQTTMEKILVQSINYNARLSEVLSVFVDSYLFYNSLNLN